MKQLTIEEKAKAYDEAKARMSEAYNSNRCTIGFMNEIFPELKESKDERIRKWIINEIKIKHHNLDEDNVDFVDKAIAWLEKQGKLDNNDTDILNRFSFYSYKDEPNILYLSGLYVNEEYRNKGIGTKILEIADEVAKSLNCHAIRLKTKKDSNAERLYRTHGYNNLATEDKNEIWLEKKGEQKPNDKIEPKFEIEKGKWYVCTQTYTLRGKIVVIKGQTYKSNQDGAIEGEDGHLFIDKIDGKALNYFKPWTIQDAKDGDVLACNNGWTCIFKTLVNDETFSSYCFMDNTKWFCETGCECHTLKEEFVKAYNGKIYPATKEQRDLLFQKMKEAGYEWDTEKKELKKIEQKPAEWHREDEQNLNACLGYIPDEFLRRWLKDAIHAKYDKHTELLNGEDYGIDGLYAAVDILQKTLGKVVGYQSDDGILEHECAISAVKKLYEQKPWSEEDEKMINAIYSCVDLHYDGLAKISLLIWLKSLKDKVQPQLQWKPSKEQIIALRWVLNNIPYNKHKEEISKLLDQIKDL